MQQRLNAADLLLLRELKFQEIILFYYFVVGHDRFTTLVNTIKQICLLKAIAFFLLVLTLRIFSKESKVLIL